MDPNETEEQDVFSFVYDKKNRSEKKSQSLSQNNLISNEKSSKPSNEKSQDALNKSNEIFSLPTKKKHSSSQQKKEKNKKKMNKEKNYYKLDILDEEVEYLFNLLKDGNANAITEITLRKALNNARMTNVDDETVKVNTLLYRIYIYSISANKNI